jgi:hypothetical protein
LAFASESVADLKAKDGEAGSLNALENRSEAAAARQLPEACPQRYDVDWRKFTFLST